MTIKIGDAVIWVDALSHPHPALVTAVWGQYNPDDPLSPGLNVVLVSTDESKDDSYGRQIERQTSQVHVSRQVAPGMYWCRVNEYNPARDQLLRTQQIKA